MNIAHTSHLTQLLVLLAIAIAFILFAHFWAKGMKEYSCKKCGRIDYVGYTKHHPGICKDCAHPGI